MITSTVTAGLVLQSLISCALDDNCFVALAGIDLSAAFDVVDIELLIRRLEIMGLPMDVVKLTRANIACYSYLLNFRMLMSLI